MVSQAESNRNGSSNLVLEGGGGARQGALAAALEVGAGLTVGEGELDVGVEELLDLRANALLLELADDLLDLDDVDGAEAGAVAAGHLLVHLSHSLVLSAGGELLVHVGGAAAGIVADPDAVLGHLVGLLLEDLTDGEDLGVGLLHLHQAANEVPETGASLRLVLGEELDAVRLGGGVALGGNVTPDDLVLVIQLCD